ncbi:TIGR01777 family oxidoreductase [Okibacterium fritillariae]|uniref:TIGR01777 family oxidoreductase n=1 Tax=Okibacterium fritillariae TaxID=123320 RepID=UPI00405555B9
MRVLIAGASGLIGTALTRSLRDDQHEVVHLVRRDAAGAGEVSWDPAAGRLDVSAFDGVDAVVNLSGASISKLPWTASYRRTLLSSRVQATRTLVEALHRTSTPPAIFASGSASGYYGSRPGETLTEESSYGDGFLAGVCVRWEAEALKAPDSVRTVRLRTGVVLALGGILKPLMPLTRFGLAGPLGSGTQRWPWVSLDDEVRGIRHVLDTDIDGPVNLVGPTPSSANDLMFHLARRLERPYLLRAPKFALKAALQQAADDLLLIDQRIEPGVLERTGFTFTHRTVEEAVDAALAAG